MNQQFIDHVEAMHLGHVSGRMFVGPEYCGMKVVIHRGQWVKRCWRDRWFSKPWRPWVTHTWREPNMPKGDALIIGNTIHCTDEFWNKLKRRIDI